MLVQGCTSHSNAGPKWGEFPPAFPGQERYLGVGKKVFQGRRRLGDSAGPCTGQDHTHAPQGAGGGPRIWHLCWILAVFPGSPVHLWASALEMGQIQVVPLCGWQVSLWAGWGREGDRARRSDWAYHGSSGQLRFVPPFEVVQIYVAQLGLLKSNPGLGYIGLQSAPNLR